MSNILYTEKRYLLSNQLDYANGYNFVSSIFDVPRHVQFFILRYIFYFFCPCSPPMPNFLFLFLKTTKTTELAQRQISPTSLKPVKLRCDNNVCSGFIILFCVCAFLNNHHHEALLRARACVHVGIGCSNQPN